MYCMDGKEKRLLIANVIETHTRAGAHTHARMHAGTQARTHAHTHTSHMHRDVHMHKPHLSAVQLPKPVVPLLQPLSQCSENEATTASGIKLFTPLQNSLRML